MNKNCLFLAGKSIDNIIQHAQGGDVDSSSLPTGLGTGGDAIELSYHERRVVTTRLGMLL